jgi:hypothetical protein
MSNFASFFGSLILEMQAHKEIEIEPIVPQERLSTNCKPPTILLVMREQLDNGAISQFLQQLRIASLSAVFSAIYCKSM